MKEVLNYIENNDNWYEELLPCKQDLIDLNEQRLFFIKLEAKERRLKNMELVNLINEIISITTREIRELRGEKSETNLDQFLECLV